MEKLDGWAPNEDSRVPPEDQAKVRLSNWFESYGATVYWEKSTDSEYDRPVFRSKNNAEKPDILIDHPDWNTLALEVKIGNDGSSIYAGAVQITRYWWIYELGKDKYQVEQKQIDPDVFVLATGNSPLGRLYNDAETKDRMKTEADMSKGRATHAVRNKERPKWEHASSETTTGIMWQIAKQRIRESDEVENEYEPSAGIGSLYSNAIDDPENHSPGVETADPGINYQKGSDTVWEVLS